MKSLYPLALTLLTTACASYTPDPLTPTPTILAPPLAHILQVQASTLARPWHTPVTVDLAAPFSLDAVAALAVVNNPDLQVLRTRSGVTEAQAFAAGLLPDPVFSINASKVLSGPDTLLNLASTLGLNLNALRQRALTRAQAEAQAQQLRLDIAWAEWQTAGQAKLQATRVSALTQLLPLVRASSEITDRQWQRAQQAATHGDISGNAAETMRLAKWDADNRLRNAQHELQIAQDALAATLGLPPDTPIKLASAILPKHSSDPIHLFAAAQDQRFDLAALRMGYQAQEKSVQLAILNQFPSLNLTISGNRDSAGNLLLGPSVDFTLPLWNRNRGAIAVERATRTALKSEYETRLFHARAEINAACRGLSLAQQNWLSATRGLSALQQQANANTTAAIRGDIAHATADTATLALYDRQQLIVQLEQAIFEQNIALELLSGGPLKEIR